MWHQVTTTARPWLRFRLRDPATASGSGSASSSQQTTTARPWLRLRLDGSGGPLQIRRRLPAPAGLLQIRPGFRFILRETVSFTISADDGGTAPATAPGSLPATWAGSSFPAAWIRPSFPQRIRRIFSEGVLYYIYNYQIPNLYRPFSGPFPASWPGASWPRLRLRDPAPAFRPVKKFFCPESIDFSGLPAFPPSFSEKFLKICA